MTNRIAWLEVASTDVPASGEFYRKLFDWPVVTDELMNYTMTNFGMDEPGIGFAAVNGDGMNPGDVVVYIDVENIDAMLDRARKLDAPVYLDKTEIPTVGWIAIVGDPGGNRIGLMQGMPRE
ncbi:MAG: hypothetical protein JXA93_25415 [Anaerolineae bacterium]|nr:hypothetical protein [Anaerolineae bacterium]